MKADIIKIGNSRGIRIPKALLDSCGLEGAVQLHVEDGKLIISPSRAIREGWSDSFKKMAVAEGDTLLLDDAYDSEWDNSEWEW